MSLSTALVTRTAHALEGRLSRRSLINRSAFVGSAVAVGSGLDLACDPAPPTAPSASAATPAVAVAAPAARGSRSSVARSADTTTAPRTPSWVAGGWRRDPPTATGRATTWTATPPVAAPPDARVASPSARRGATGQLRVRVAGVRLLPDRVSAVPLRTVQPGRRVHGTHRVPGRRLCATVAG